MKQMAKQTQARRRRKTPLALDQAAYLFLQSLQSHAANAPEQANLGWVLMTALRELKNSEAKQALAAGKSGLPQGGKFIYKQLLDDVLSGAGLQPGDVIVIDPHRQIDQGDLVVGIRADNQTYVAGYHYQLANGRYVLSTIAEAGYWHFQPSEVDILGRIVGFDAFYGLEDLEAEGGTR